MDSLEEFFINNKFEFFTYIKQNELIVLNRSEDNSNDSFIFDELKEITAQLMKEPFDFHILDNGDIKLQKS